MSFYSPGGGGLESPSVTCVVQLAWILFQDRFLLWMSCMQLWSIALIVFSNFFAGSRPFVVCYVIASLEEMVGGQLLNYLRML